MHWKWGDKLQFKLKDCVWHSTPCWICTLHNASSPMTCFRLSLPYTTADAKFWSGKLITDNHAWSQVIKLSKLVLFSPQFRTKLHFNRKSQLQMYTFVICFQTLANPSFKPLLPQDKLYFTLKEEEKTWRAACVSVINAALLMDLPKIKRRSCILPLCAAGSCMDLVQLQQWL